MEKRIKKYTKELIDNQSDMIGEALFNMAATHTGSCPLEKITSVGNNEQSVKF